MQNCWVYRKRHLRPFVLSNALSGHCNLVPTFVFIFNSVCKTLHLSSNISILICIVLYLTVGLFTNVVAKWPGSTHDSFVFTNSLIHERLESNHAFEDGYLLGDSGYPCKPFLMTPYPNIHSECRMKPEKVCTLIGACAVLHNISIRLNDDIDDDPFDDDQPELVPYHGPDQGRLLRDHICNTFF